MTPVDVKDIRETLLEYNKFVDYAIDLYITNQWWRDDDKGRQDFLDGEIHHRMTYAYLLVNPEVERGISDEPIYSDTELKNIYNSLDLRLLNETYRRLYLVYAMYNDSWYPHLNRLTKKYDLYEIIGSNSFTNYPFN